MEERILSDDLIDENVEVRLTDTYVVVPNWIRAHPDIDATAISVWCALWSFSSGALDKRKCWPGLEAISTEAKASVRTVQRRLQTLEEIGAISRHRTQSSNVYTLHFAGGHPDHLEPPNPTWSQMPSRLATPDHPDTSPVANEQEPRTRTKNNNHFASQNAGKENLKSLEKHDSHESEREDGPPKTTLSHENLFQALVIALGYSPSTASERGAWNRAVKEIRALNPTRDEVTAKVKNYRSRWPGIDCTPNALAKHWRLLGQPVPNSNPLAPESGKVHTRPEQPRRF